MSRVLDRFKRSSECSIESLLEVPRQSSERSMKDVLESRAWRQERAGLFRKKARSVVCRLATPDPLAVVISAEAATLMAASWASNSSILSNGGVFNHGTKQHHRAVDKGPIGARLPAWSGPNLSPAALMVQGKAQLRSAISTTLAELGFSQHSVRSAGRGPALLPVSNWRGSRARLFSLSAL